MEREGLHQDGWEGNSFKRESEGNEIHITLQEKVNQKRNHMYKVLRRNVFEEQQTDYYG